MNKTYNLEYWVGPKHIETVHRNKTFGFIKSESIKLKTEEKYKLGKFVIKPN